MFGAMKVLAVDTTTARGSVALVDGGEVAGEVRLIVGSHSSQLVPAVAFLLERLGLGPGDVGGYAVAVGPGSFTGLRVGISTVQGLALASGRPCLGVPALDVLAERIRGCAEELVAMIDAFRGEVFAAVYDAEARPRGGPVVEEPGAFLARVGPAAAFVGDGALLHRDAILRLRPRAAFPRRSLYLAGTLGRLAEPRLAAGEGVGPEALRPLYLRDAPVRKPS
jgi:tRNA threonylcarbamoyladenosine biosynthesis protein TsaB